jgi:hypothetical protein
MSVTPIKNLGQGGLNKDMSPILLPQNVFTGAKNVRFRNGSVETILGESTFATVSNTPDFGIHWRRPDASYTIVGKNGNFNRISNTGVETPMLASGSYIGSKWQGDYFGAGYAVFINNGVDTPLYALYNDPLANLTFQPFPGWNYTAGLTVTAKVIRPFNYSLVAANLTLIDGGGATYAPSTVRISVQAAVGGFPTVWAPGLTTDTADEFEINTTSPIVDMQELRGQMFIYSSDSIHVLSLVNGIANVRPYSRGYGALSINCIAEFDGQHFVVDRNDIYVHNGSGQVKSLAYARVRDFFFGDINQSYTDNTFVVKNNSYKEIWVCYVSSANNTGKCDRALVYNYKEDNWTLRDLPLITSMFPSPDLNGSNWEYGNERLLATSNSPRVYLMDDTNLMYDNATSGYTSYDSFVERERLFADDPFGNIYISGIAPVLEVNEPSGSVSVYVTGQNIYDKPASFSNLEGRDMFTISPQSENHGYKVDPRTVGRFLNYRITNDSYWKLSFMGLDLKPANRR